MRMIFIALKDLKTIFRDKKALAIMLLMPALIILILGSSLSKAFTNELLISRFSVGVVNNDNGQLSQIFIDKVLKDQMKDLFDVLLLSEQEANDMLSKDTIPVVIFIPQSFSDSLQTQNSTELKLKYQSGNQIKGSIAESVSSGFATTTSLLYSSATAISDIFEQYENNNISSTQKQYEVMAIMDDLQQNITSTILNFTEVNQEAAKNVSSMQYYSVAMLAMFLLFGGNMGSKLMAEERDSKTLERVMITKASRTSLIIGKFIGLVVICLCQAVILIMFTRVFYGVRWGHSMASLPIILLLTIFSAVTAAAVGMFVGSIARTGGTADSLGMIMIQLFTLIGGGMIPIYVMPKILTQIANITPNLWVTKGYLNIMLGGEAHYVLLYCGVLMIMSIFYLGVGIYKFKA